MHTSIFQHGIPIFRIGTTRLALVEQYKKIIEITHCCDFKLKKLFGTHIASFID